MRNLKEYYEEYRSKNPEPFAVDLIEIGLFELGRFRFLNKRLRSVVTKNDVTLDVGCGLGFAELELLRTIDFGPEDNFQMIGLDIAISALRNAKQKMKQGKKKLGITTTQYIHFVAGDANSVPIRTGSIDKVICSATLEHVPNDKSVMTQLLEVLKPRGKILLFVPIKENFLPLSLEWMRQKAGTYRRPPEHFRHYNREMILSILFSARLLSLEYGGIFFSNYISALSQILGTIYIKFLSMTSFAKVWKEFVRNTAKLCSKIYDIDELFTQMPRGLYAIVIAQKNSVPKSSYFVREPHARATIQAAQQVYQ